MVSEDFEVGDLVWAKMKGYPPWPAKVVNPPPNIKPPKNKKAHYVVFFGPENFAWILDENIRPHSESMMNNLGNKKRTVQYQSAIDALIHYTKTQKKEKRQPVKAKKDKNESEKKPRIKVMKVVNSVSKKHERKVFGSKSPTKKHRKRSLDDVNGESSEDFHSKSPKMQCHSDDLSEFSDSPQYDEPKRDNVNVRYPEFSASTLKFGFIGLGMMGKQIVKTLLLSGHDVSVWNKTSSQCDYFVSMGAKKANTPADLIVNCDVTFSCVADPEASKAVIFGDDGVLKGLDQVDTPKGYVEMTTIDPTTSTGNAEAIAMKRGSYLEAPLCGTSKDGETGTLLILAAGDRVLFQKCQSCFHAMGKYAYFISCDVGDGSRMSLVLSMLSGTVCAALAEAMVLVDRLKLEKKQFLECLTNGPLNCKIILDKAHKMANLSFKQVTALKHIQKDIGLSLTMGNILSQQMPVTAAANEVYKHGKLSRYSNEDMSAVYKVAKY